MKRQIQATVTALKTRIDVLSAELDKIEEKSGGQILPEAAADLELLSRRLEGLIASLESTLGEAETLLNLLQ